MAAGAGWRQVYPRVCGGTAAAAAAAEGLSPRVRGNPGYGRGEARERRSIPACAGEPPPFANGMMWSAVYPLE